VHTVMNLEAWNMCRSGNSLSGGPVMFLKILKFSLCESMHFMGFKIFSW
jgi:hypothetical protein